MKKQTLTLISLVQVVKEAEKCERGRKHNRTQSETRDEEETACCPDSCILSTHIHAADRRFKRGWISTKLGELVLDSRVLFFSWFEDGLEEHHI